MDVTTSTLTWEPTLGSRSENSTSPISSQTPLSCQSLTSSLVQQEKGLRIWQIDDHSSIVFAMFQGPDTNLYGWF